MEPVTAIPNVGPATAAAFARAGITTAAEVRAMGADAAYAALLRVGERPHFIGYYVLVMGLQGRPWNDAQGAEKAALRARFDAIKAEVQAGPKASEGIERILREIGLVPGARP
jgi:DNA transformation protein and related proteins